VSSARSGFPAIVLGAFPVYIVALSAFIVAAGNNTFPEIVIKWKQRGTGGIAAGMHPDSV
jgi:hypothetical protein